MNASIDQAAIDLGVATPDGRKHWIRAPMAPFRSGGGQVVSGIGFLGAAIIFRKGLQVTGLNTAATLRCSAAVGLLAGSGHPLHAALAKTGRVEVTAQLTAPSKNDAVLEQVVGRLSLEPTVQPPAGTSNQSLNSCRDLG